ncbi:gag-pol polyprotein [Trichonephila clavipes]|nr:gag-pol polyprotein [Trichonephila clavipes]
MAEPSKHTSRLFLLDRKSGQKFLIDSGSEICVIPPSPTMNKSPQSNFSLFAANNTKIPAYDANISFRNILSEYPDLSNPSLISKSASHGTVHHIITTGPPVTARPRRLHPKLYDAVKVRRTQSLLNWSSEAITAFQRCKQALADAALLAHPSPSAPLALHVDASDYAIGGALHQVVDSQLQPLAFFSRKLTSSEKSYSAYDRELPLLSTRLSDTFGICWKLEISQCLLITSPSLMLLGKKVTSVLHGRSLWARHCLACQKSKIHRHTRSPLSSFQEPSQRFDHVHLDLIGPLPPSNGYTYCLTMIDRFSKWPEAQPLKDITAETVAEAFFPLWVSRFGTPAILTTDRGRQFESSLFKALSKLFGVQKCRTTDTTLKLMG